MFLAGNCFSLEQLKVLDIIYFYSLKLNTLSLDPELELESLNKPAMATPVFIKVLLTVMVIGAFANACGGGCFCPANKRIPCPAGFCPGRDGRSKSLPSRLRVDITTVEEDSGSQGMKGTRY